MGRVLLQQVSVSDRGGDSKYVGSGETAWPCSQRKHLWHKTLVREKMKYRGDRKNDWN